MRKVVIASCLLFSANLLPAPAFPADAPTIDGTDAAGIKPPGVIGIPGGTGPMPAVAEAIAGMRDNTIYRPISLPEGRLPLLLWGEGGCFDNGLLNANFLREVASHGYIIIAAGHPRAEMPPLPPGAPMPSLAQIPGASRAAELSTLVAGIDWAIRQDADAESPFRDHIDTARIGVMGHSCGGLQAIALATDRRVRTAIAFNSGVLHNPPPNMPPNAAHVVDSAALKDLKGPIAYINGGPTDIAYENAKEDFALIGGQPVFFAENGVGHGGTFQADAHGGAYADVAVAWMDWQLKGEARAGRLFLGRECGLCTRQGWKVVKKGFSGE